MAAQISYIIDNLKPVAKTVPDISPRQESPDIYLADIQGEDILSSSPVPELKGPDWVEDILSLSPDICCYCRRPGGDICPH